MTEILLKVVHVATMSIWVGGLIWLPGLLTDLSLKNKPDAVHVQRFGRFAYDIVVSPAALLAIASGAALVFAADAAQPWFFLKLAVIAGLIGVHMLIGRSLDWEHRAANPISPRGRLALVAAASALSAVILWLVLQKPMVDAGLFPEWLRVPLDQDAGERPLAASSSIRSSSSLGVATPT